MALFLSHREDADFFFGSLAMEKKLRTQVSHHNINVVQCIECFFFSPQG